ncbi:MAG: hypothetical protein M3004_13000, partial [Bacteroidota bacterium]|nr:hypothetical protein [Bacteroidota bacterium]
PEYNESKIPTDQYIQDIQGYYFAQTGKGEFTDSEVSMRSNKEIYELILQKKEELLSIDNEVQFIFSHSALGVGWDNPNVFNIATLNLSYSEIKKRQEIGRGLRICVNQQGQRIYDALNVEDANRINQLTVIPNETYETFVTQYQEEIKAIYGSTNAGAGMTHTHKGVSQDEVKFKRNPSDSIDKAFKRFWNSLAKKTDYVVSFNEENLIQKSTEEINKITIPDYVAEVSSRSISALSEEEITDEFGGTETYKLKAKFTALDLVEELSETTGLSYNTLFEIVKNINNHEEWIKNPPRFVHEASAIIKNTELNEMLRGLDYELTGEEYPFNFNDYVKNISANNVIETPNKGVFDKMIYDSYIERTFCIGADRDAEVVCFIKLPSWYQIKTPIGDYEPDFGLVMKRKSLKSGIESEFYFVIETKGTNDINDKKALTESEWYKIKCAMKHFTTLGVEVYYKAPVKDYAYFKTEADKTINTVTA